MENIGQAFDLRPVSLRRRRFLMVSVAVLAVLGMALGVSFMADSGATEVGVTSAASDFVFPIANGSDLPNGVDMLPYTGNDEALGAPGDGGASDTNTNGTVANPLVSANTAVTTADLPSWTPIANSGGTVGSGGDLALIDATDLGNSPAITVSMYITNVEALQRMYSSYAFDVEVWQATEATCEAAGTTSCDWDHSSLTSSSQTFLTHTDAFLTFSMVEGFYYAITMDDGGSLYCISTSASGGSLSPSFYFTGQPS